ncbi:MAG TPA: hypothetical protein VL334_06990, partial [Anaerolineae bacterium]|nr:hypothetical protein [Anaerolineae bacterium]
MPEREHIFQLLETHRRRLQQLELQSARSGHNTSPEIIIEIEDITQKITRLERQLIHHLGQMEIIIAGDFSKYSLDVQSATIGAFAEILDIPRESIRVVSIRSGSIVLRLELPTEALDRMIALHETNDRRLESMGVTKVQVIDSRSSEKEAEPVDRQKSL